MQPTVCAKQVRSCKPEVEGAGEGELHPRSLTAKTPEKWWLEDYFPIGKVTFQGLGLD